MIPASRSPRPTAIVGIGASAGGLEALEQFLRHVPPGSGLALVIVQHLDPTHKGIMPELLQRATGMKVCQVKDRTKVRADCVYVIPPNKDMSILHGVLYLLEPTAPRGLRLPIDFFLRSLAQDRQERSIGVILSGMGCDGTLGLRAIKEKAGVVLVQEPATAKFDGMPRSAVDAGLADIVAPVEVLPENLIRDPPFTKLDLLSCRNLLIYLAPEVQKKLIPLFHYSLGPGGFLFLGSAETIGADSDLFVPLGGKSRVFRRSEADVRPAPVELPSAFAAGPATVPEARRPAGLAVSLQSLADQLILQRYAPPAVLVNDQGDILYVSGRTGKYLEPAAGKANWNLFAMAREGLRYELAGAFRRALRQSAGVTLHSLQIATNGGQQSVEVTVQRLDETGPLHGLVMITFSDVAGTATPTTTGRSPLAHGHQARRAELEQELLRVRAEARATHEEVRRFTQQATKIIKLIPGDVGRPVTDLVLELNYPTLAADAREVLRTLAPTERPASARDGRWFSVRIMPYRTTDDFIDGVVITFADITTARNLEGRLRANQAGLRRRIAHLSPKRDALKGKRRVMTDDG